MEPGPIDAPLLAQFRGGTPRSFQVHAALVAAQVCFSGWHLVGKFALSSCHVNPLIFALYREVASSAVLFGAAYVLEGLRLPSRDHVEQFALLGVLYFGNVVGMLLGLALTTAANAAMMQPLCPLFVWFLGAYAGTETPSLWRGVGLILATAGAFVLAAGAFVLAASTLGSSSAAAAALLGNLLLLVQVACIAGSIVLQKHLLVHYGPLNLTAWGYGLGACFTMLASITYAGDPEVWRLTRSASLWSLVYAVVFATCITYTLMTWANKYTHSSTVGVYQVLAPLLTAIASTLFFGAAPTFLMVAGGALIMVGLVVTASIPAVGVKGQGIIYGAASAS